MEINAYIRDPSTTNNYTKMTRDIDKQLYKGIMTKEKEKYVGKYYIVYRCLKDPKGFNPKTEWFMSTSNEKITKFGNSCLRIFVPIETPVLVGNISAAVSSKSTDNTYEFLIPRNTELIFMGEDTKTKEYFYGDYYVKKKLMREEVETEKERLGPVKPVVFTQNADKRDTKHAKHAKHTRKRENERQIIFYIIFICHCTINMI